MFRRLVTTVVAVVLVTSVFGCGGGEGGGVTPGTEANRIKRIESKGGHLGGRQKEMSDDAKGGASAKPEQEAGK